MALSHAFRSVRNDRQAFSSFTDFGAETETTEALTSGVGILRSITIFPLTHLGKRLMEFRKAGGQLLSFCYSDLYIGKLSHISAVKG